MSLPDFVADETTVQKLSMHYARMAAVQYDLSFQPHCSMGFANGLKKNML